MRFPVLHRLPYWLLVGAVWLILSACSQQSSDAGAAMPDFVQGAPPRVQEAYRYAMAHPGDVAKYPCYCGCGSMGHTSNLSCYISDIASDGTVTFDNHAAGCGICVDITQDVMRLRGEGRSALETRAYIDATYGAFGPGTDTPLPTE